MGTKIYIKSVALTINSYTNIYLLQEYSKDDLNGLFELG